MNTLPLLDWMSEAIEGIVVCIRLGRAAGAVMDTPFNCICTQQPSRLPTADEPEGHTFGVSVPPPHKGASLIHTYSDYIYFS